MIPLKTPQEIEIMREGGHILAVVIDALSAAVKPGIRTEELETLTRQLIADHKAKPSFLGYNKFPAALCVSINEEIVHGVPSDRVLKNGDLVTLDLGVEYKGFHTDSARTLIAGSSSDVKVSQLIDVTREALVVGIEAAQPGNTLGDVGAAIHTYVKSQGLDVVRDLVGHGIGKTVHEPPEVPNYGKAGQGPKLVAGMTIAIEPMVVLGSSRIAAGPDGYSYITADKKLSAHFEHTVVITKDGPVILTI